MSCIITITGALGSGKSTIAGILCEKLGFEQRGLTYGHAAPEND